MNFRRSFTLRPAAWLSRRFGALAIFGLVFLVLSFATRVALLTLSAHEVTWDASLLAAFAWGMLFDLGTATWLSLPLTVALVVLPAGVFRRPWVRSLAWAAIYGGLAVLLFGAVAEWVFWEEFGVRFNFIAVDYLVYTTEVLGNIRESYPLPWIFAGLIGGAAILFLLLLRSGLPAAWMRGEHETWPRRCALGGAWLAGAIAFGAMLSDEWIPGFRNNFNRELARNGPWSLVAAFRANELDYDQFYETLPLDKAFARLRHELTEDGSILLRPDEYDSLRYIANTGKEVRPNIIQITVESLSASFLGSFNPESDLTPNLDELASKSLLFDNVFATGTRTDRGMEALTLSLPPTPGRSIVKRPNNDNLFTLGSVLRARDYDTAFIYGGYGYFDNMNQFFGDNGYRIVDRSSVEDDDVTFANAWGACDEDLYRWTLREADAAHTSGRPFHFFVMTTSNHRPYTFPDGRIDLPSKTSGRAGAVKYTDFAIGQFIRDASSKPWFKDTVFVIVADHCAASAGRMEIPVSNYHIPLIVYAPGGHIPSGRISTLTSQMDVAPTLLGLLNWSYPSRFFGHDIRRIAPEVAHALIGTYQKLGHLERGEFVVLKPLREESGYLFDPATDSQIEHGRPSKHAEVETIGFYQTASHMFRNGLYRALSREEFLHYSALGHAEAKAKSVAAGAAN